MHVISSFRLLLLPATLLLFAVVQFPRYGIVAPQPIGPYLNGAFPESITEATPAPPLLSLTGAFEDLEALEPVDGLIPYALNAPFWSDGAIKSRWIAIPNDGTHDAANEQIVYSEEGRWQYPEGSVTVKHFDMLIDETNNTRRRLETRFIVKGPQDSFYHVTYRWNEDETDAVLLETAETETLAIRTNKGVRFQQWLYPSRENCVDCHRAGSGSFLGLSARQLNGDFLYPQTGVEANQLATLNSLGIFSEDVDENSLNTLLTAKSLDDGSATLEERALSYLDTNCGYCHFPGSITTARFDARMTTPLENSAIINGFVFNNNGIQNAAVVAPGDTAKSLVYFRMRNIGNMASMPPIAKAVVDTAGLKLIEDWIFSLGSGVSIEEETEAPIRFNASIYPNPFTSQARLEYTVETPMPVTIDLFDATGRRIQQLNPSYKAAGTHTVELGGHHLARGTYFVRLSAGDQVTTRVLTKQ